MCLVFYMASSLPGNFQFQFPFQQPNPGQAISLRKEHI